nr:PREDICTED: homeobox protein prospero isoform X2 [Bemisia tabaci]XP_018915231.1 PREDICTED: homeobox protein prospero isoform X2 [Bemisia tabaci]
MFHDPEISPHQWSPHGCVEGPPSAAAADQSQAEAQMMSSEEENDSFGLLKNKKRARQRVDAGEPRNSYSSIPNFSSRPSFLNSNLYSAFFSQNPQHFGLFNQGCAPAKMLNELFARQVKTASEADGSTMMTMDTGNTDVNVGVNFDCLGQTPAIHRGLDVNSSPPPGDVASYHKLRDILQGRKKDILALEQEFHSVNNSAQDRNSPDNNNTITNNNNNNNELKNGLTNGSGVSDNSAVYKNVKSEINLEEQSGDEDATGDEEMNEVGDDIKSELLVENLNGHASDSERGTPSPVSDSPKDDNDDSNRDPSAPKTEQIELKRARVENIVSSMRSSPSLITQVKGCNKRKLYHPQQHDNSAVERFANMNVNDNLNLSMDEDEEMEEDDDNDNENDTDETSPNELKQKIVEKDALKNQLRTMQEALVEMQEKYVRLCSRMDRDQNDDTGSDVEENLPEKAQVTPSSTPVKEPTTPRASTPVSQPVIPPAMSKMISKLQHPKNPYLPPHLPVAPNFNNGALSMIQQQVLQEHNSSNLGQHHHLPHHPALSNTAAMYLGVSHKLFMEQEARMAKEAAMAAEQQHLHQQQQFMNQHHHHPHAQQHQHHQQQQQQAQQHQQHQQQKHQSNNQAQLSQSGNAVNSQKSLAENQPNDFSERLSMLRSSVMGSSANHDLEGLADVLKSEITSSLSHLIDSIMSRFMQQRRYLGKLPESASAASAEQLNKDLLLASQLLDRKTPRTKVIDRGNAGAVSDRPNGNGPSNVNNPLVGLPQKINGSNFSSMNPGHQNNPSSMASSNANSISTPTTVNSNVSSSNPENNLNTINLPHVKASPTAPMFSTPKPPPNNIGALYNMSSLAPFNLSESRESLSEQNEALSLVVGPKKKRHKVTDTRITPRTVSRILAQDGPGGNVEMPGKFNNLLAMVPSGSESPPAPSQQKRPYHAPPPPMLPVSLPTSVAIPNPSLHESQVYSPYSPFYHQSSHMPSSSPPGMELRDSPPLSHPPSLLHPALLAAAQHGGSPDYGNMRSSSTLGGADSMDRGSDCASADGMTPTISFSDKNLNHYSATLTPMHLRKAKLMFFWVRYPSSAVLKMYFPDIKFNKNNTAQLVKWFSNFREFYYIQMEKYARQAVSEGVKNADDLHVSGDCEIYRVLNLHYNRNNHIEVWGLQVPQNFRYVVEQTLREFFKAIQTGKDSEQSWKKAIYKIISRLDDPVPDYFKTPNFLEQLE